MTPKLTVLLFSTALSVPFVTPLSAQSNSIACDNLNRVLSEDLTAPVLEMEADLRALVDQDNNQACLDALIDVNRELADSSDTDQVDLADTSETTVTIEDEIVMEGTVFLDRQPPEVDVAGGETDVQIEPGNPNVQVTQGQLDIVVKQAAANLSVEMPAPIIRIDQPAPEIIITMPNPDVVVGAAQPQVEVRQAEPTISVTQAAPKVDLDIRRAADGSAGTGIGISDNATGADYAAGASTEAQPVEDAVVSFNSADPKVTILEPENQSEVTIEKSEPAIRFEQAEPSVEIASQGEAQIEFNQVGEPTITFAENQSDAEQQNLLAEGTGDELEQSAETVKTEAPVELSGPMVEREGYSLVVDGEIEYGSLAGMSVYGINDEDVGEVGDVVLTEDGNVKDLVLDVGGFLGLGEKNVALPFEEFSILRSNDGDTRVYIDTTQEALENMPDYEG